MRVCLHTPARWGGDSKHLALFSNFKWSSAPAWSCLLPGATRAMWASQVVPSCKLDCIISISHVDASVSCVRYVCINRLIRIGRFSGSVLVSRTDNEG